MAYTSPSTRATGYVTTATDWNVLVNNWLDGYESHNHAGTAATGAGTLTVAAGSAGSPSYTTSGNSSDTNTGMYFPAADTIGFTTGGTLRLSLDTTTVGNAATSWTPTVSGAVSAIGSSTFSAYYHKIGRRVHFSMYVTFAGATFTAGDMTVTLPLTAARLNTAPTEVIGVAMFYDIGTTNNSGVAVMQSTTTMKFRVSVAGSALVTNTVPHTWANTDILSVQGSYETAA